MRIFFILQFVFFLSQLPFAQNEVVSLLEKPGGLEIGLHFKQEPFSQKFSVGRTVIEYFNFINEGLPGTPILPSKTYFIAIPPHSEVRIQLTEQKYSVFKNSLAALNPEVNLSIDSSIIYNESQLDLTIFTTDQYPISEIEIIGYTWIRDYYCAIVRINTHSYFWKKKEIRELVSSKLNIDFSEIIPYSKNESPVGEFDKILDKIILNYNDASQYRSSKANFIQQDTTENWIDYNKEYIKVHIPDDGIYRIDYDQLISYGVDLQGLNPKTLKLFLKGKEVPLFVFGENDLSFDQGDYIEFWSEKNYGSSDYKDIVATGEDYKNYFDRYSDTTSVWLSWDGNDGKRVNLQNISMPGLTDTLSTHKAFQHLEEDERLWYYDAVLPRAQLPYWQENKVWTWYRIDNGLTVSISFQAFDFVPNSMVNVTSRMISNATLGPQVNCHRFGLSLNSSNPQDTIFFSFKETVNFSADYNTNQLSSGNNIVRVFGMQNDSLIGHQALIDWVDIDYQRSNVAINDSILIRINDDIFSSEKVVKVTGITQQSPDILVYKTKPQIKKIDSFNISNSVLTFTDTVSALDEYYIIKKELCRQPIFVAKKYFTNLRNTNQGADYIAISNKILQPAADEYINFINNNYSTRNNLVFVDDIFDEFSYGNNEAEAIQRFLEFAYSNWTPPAPSYLLLLGDANYDYKNKMTPPPAVIRKNLVPSFGNPVSDNWFTMWDTSNVNLPQMFVGRIPVNSNEELNFYLDKHQKYINRRSDDFNKRYIFFTGGDIADSNQIELLKSANSYVLNNYVKPAPVGGQGIHFYKTVTPPTNFGPYTPEQVDNAIDSSALFISYIGHSGTETWDNGILDVSDLKNSFNDRLPLISDFGCSTGKFAEPDIDAFGELFVADSTHGQAICYLGNTSWGYVSTSVNFPKLFYQMLLSEPGQIISEVHYLSKIQLFSLYGTSDVNRVFNYCNNFFGDPILNFILPDKPNLSVSNNSFKSEKTFPLDTDDSLLIHLYLFNLGYVHEDSVSITIRDNYLSSQNYFSEYKIPIPLYKKILKVNIPIKNKVGNHNLTVTIDETNQIEELYEDDNSANFNYIVYSTSVRPIESEQYYNAGRSEFKFLNPVLNVNQSQSTIRVAVSDNQQFTNQIEETFAMDTIFTISQVPQLQENERYWWRARLDLPQSVWSQNYSFINNDHDFNWYFGKSFNYSDIQFENVLFDSTDNRWKLTDYNNLLEIRSAGSDDGEFGSIKFNGSEKLPTTFYWGIATAIIDSITLEPSNYNYWLYWDPYADTLLINYINSLPSGTLLAMTICADGAEPILGWVSGTPVRQAIETLGSLYIDSVFYRDSWCILGKKGALQGTVPEAFRNRYSGSADLDTTVTLFNDNGWIEFPAINNAARWLNVIKVDSVPAGSTLDFIPLGIKTNGITDTLSSLQFVNNIAEIGSINADLYPSLKLISKFQVNEFDEAPVFAELGVNFVPLPDLAINYQVVSVSNDSVLIGEDIDLFFYIYNVGESKADSFNVKVEVINEDNSRQTIFTQQVDSLKSDERKFFEATHNTASGSGSKTFLINIDSENNIRELFEDNNYFSVPFYIKPDTTKPTITLTFDGSDILDGDYISSNPSIRIELNDQSLLPINDPSSVLIYLNDILVPIDTSIIAYTFSETNPKVTVDFTPALSDGDYELKVLWKNSNGNIVDSSGVEKFFLVSSEAKLLNVYNYPNPSRGETHFTFKLTQIPEEIRIKIFTIAGRLVREIKLTDSALKYDFNKIYWDGRDEDGDVLANGVYLYKVIMKVGDKSEEVTQKLAIVK